MAPLPSRIIPCTYSALANRPLLPYELWVFGWCPRIGRNGFRDRFEMGEVTGTNLSKLFTT